MTEVTNMLIKNAPDAAGQTLTWSRVQPIGVSMKEHFQSFLFTLEQGRRLVYDRTRRFAPNWILIASDILPVLSMIDGFVAAPAGNINGPYFAGTVQGMKVFVTPNIAAGTFVMGVLGSDLMSAAAVYAPYMPELLWAA